MSIQSLAGFHYNKFGPSLTFIGCKRLLCFMFCYKIEIKMCPTGITVLTLIFLSSWNNILKKHCFCLMDTLNPHQSEYLIRKVVCSSIIEWVCVVCCVTILTMNDYCCKLSNTKPKLPCFRKANGHQQCHGSKRFVQCIPWPGWEYWAAIKTSAANQLIGEVVQSRRRPLVGPSPGWKRLLPLSHLRHY